MQRIWAARPGGLMPSSRRKQGTAGPQNMMAIAFIRSEWYASRRMVVRCDGAFATKLTHLTAEARRQLLVSARGNAAPNRRVVAKRALPILRTNTQ